MFEKLFNKGKGSENAEDNFSPTEKVIANLINDMSYHLQYLEGTDRENGVFYFQPLRVLEGPEETGVSNNATALSINELDALATELRKDLESTGILARVEISTVNPAIRVEIVDENGE